MPLSKLGVWEGLSRGGGLVRLCFKAVASATVLWGQETGEARAATRRPVRRPLPQARRGCWWLRPGRRREESEPTFRMRFGKTADRVTRRSRRRWEKHPRGQNHRSRGKQRARTWSTEAQITEAEEAPLDLVTGREGGSSFFPSSAHHTQEVLQCVYGHPQLRLTDSLVPRLLASSSSSSWHR